ncbi:glycoside hydrolase 15 protein [Geranomyces variabilis]|nr:glycoside hydrolase 15 protein [Geranomyces variabilis]
MLSARPLRGTAVATVVIGCSSWRTPRFYLRSNNFTGSARMPVGLFYKRVPGRPDSLSRQIRLTTPLLSTMQLTSLALLCFAAGIHARAVLSPRASSNINPDVTQFLARQVPIAEARMIAHINGDGAVVAGAAAPVLTPGDAYQYYWVRDGGLTMAALADLYAATKSSDVPSKWDAFYQWTVKTQATARASSPGWFKEQQAWTKYSLDGQPYQQWMSPQYDGPALRASAFIKWAKASGNAGKYYVASDPKSVIKTDLDSIVNSYTVEDGYEPWEEVIGEHFFVHMTQHRALLDGADLAASLGDNAGAQTYRATAQKVRDLLNAFWDGSNHFKATLGGKNGGQNQGAQAKCDAGAFVDISSILAIIHASDDSTFPANDPKVQSTFYEMIRAFTQGAYKPKTVLSDWSLNQKDTTFNGLPMNPAVGRYPEDIYDGAEYTYAQSKGAGFWFLATNAMAETLYKAVAANDRTGAITITAESVGFWNFIGLANAKPQSIAKGTPAFAQAQLLLVDNADRFIRRTAKYVTPEGYMSEQFQFATGAQQGTQDLAWSYASVVSASLARTAALSLVDGGAVVVPTPTPTPTTGPVQPTPTPPTAGVCPVSDADKKDCGFAGITQSGCEVKNCCWKASTPGSNVPWCFSKVDTTTRPPVGPSCNVALASKKDCGFAGINQSGCEAKGCCWAPLTVAGPWCFVKA